MTLSLEQDFATVRQRISDMHGLDALDRIAAICEERGEYVDQMNEILSRTDVLDYWQTIGKSCSLGEAFFLGPDRRVSSDFSAQIDVNLELRLRTARPDEHPALLELELDEQCISEPARSRFTALPVVAHRDDARATERLGG